MHTEVFYIQNYHKTVRYNLRDEFAYEEYHSLDAPEHLLQGSMIYVKAYTENYNDFVSPEYSYRETLGDFGIW